MRLRTVAFFFSLFARLVVLADTKYILIDGGVNPESNYVRYYNSVLSGYQALKGRDADVTVVAKDGTWKMQHIGGQWNSSENLLTKERMKDGKIIFPPIDAPANVSSLEASIKGKAKENETVYLHFTGHGSKPKPGMPETAIVNLFGEDISYNQLQELLSRYPKTKFKIYSGVCWGGGVHTISRNLPNVCSASATSYFSTSVTASQWMNNYEHSIWNYIDYNNEVSLGKMALESFQKDFVNDLGNLSSFDYIDFVLKKGPYEKKYPMQEGVDFPAEPFKKFQHVAWESPPLSFPNDKMARTIAPKGYQATFTRDKISLNFDLSLNNDCVFSNSISNDIHRIASLAKVINGITEKVNNQTVKDSIDRQPKQIQTVFHSALNDMNENGEKYLKIAKDYESKFRSLVTKWRDKNGELAKNTENWQKEGEARKEMQKQFEDLRSSAKKDLRPYFFNHQILNILQSLEEFNDKATPEQKNKFIQLLQCEWEPM